MYVGHAKLEGWDAIACLRDITAREQQGSQSGRFIQIAEHVGQDTESGFLFLKQLKEVGEF